MKKSKTEIPAGPRSAGSDLPFAEFAAEVYPFLELQRFHLTYYRLLEEFAAGRVRRLMITMPPQHGKSVGATTLLPAYMLGLDPDLRIAIASYSASLASRFNRRIQRIVDSAEYGALFPETTIKRGSKPPEYIRTADEFEVVGHHGGVLSVGREGALTGNRVDCFILDDLYKDAMEANSPIVRENCWEWYTSVVRTRMHNSSRELIVFTRWHEDDLIGELVRREPVVTLREWSDLDTLEGDEWVCLNFEALKTTPPCGIDPRTTGEALWEERQSRDLLLEKRRLDPLRFECMYQGHPSSREGLLYGDGFGEYDFLPREIVRKSNYTDTADTGDDYLCSLCYEVDADGVIYITDAVYTREAMEVTEGLVGEMIARAGSRSAMIESNNGGRGFARAVQKLVPTVRIGWFHQSGNKEARILSNSATVLHNIRFPRGWAQRWPELHSHLVTYRRKFRSNRWHDAPDVLTGIVEQEVAVPGRSRIKGVRFF
ncbi:MAG TPA: phage terminase large subunit [Candidatus Alistipes excrementipullorum]|nr:phage terminase large subunit [Candidatus Alistipes excrementipullorum]